MLVFIVDLHRRRLTSEIKDLKEEEDEEEEGEDDLHRRSGPGLGSLSISILCRHNRKIRPKHGGFVETVRNQHVSFDT